MNIIRNKSLIIKLSLLVFFACVTLMMPKTVKASVVGSIKYAKHITVSKGGIPNWWKDECSINMGSKTKGASRIVVKSSNTKVIKPMKPYKVKGSWQIGFYQKKPGKATLKISVWKNGKKHTYKTKVKVIKWINPFNSIKIGGQEYNNLFDNSFFGTSNAGIGNALISVQLKDGWKINKIRFYDYSKKGYFKALRKIKNNGVCKITSTSMIEMRVSNTRTHQTEVLQLAQESAPIQLG